MWERGEGGNREVSPCSLLGTRGDLSGAGAEAYPEEGGEPKGSDHSGYITSSRNSWKRRTSAAATSRPAAAFKIGIVPAAASVPFVPSSTTFSRYAAPAISAAIPTAA